VTVQTSTNIRSGLESFLKAPGVEPVFPKKDQAIDYAQSRACFGSSEIRILDCLVGCVAQIVARQERGLTS
jgi:hypothetical protein